MSTLQTLWCCHIYTEARIKTNITLCKNNTNAIVSAVISVILTPGVHFYSLFDLYTCDKTHDVNTPVFTVYKTSQTVLQPVVHFLSNKPSTNCAQKKFNSIKCAEFLLLSRRIIKVLILNWLNHSVCVSRFAQFERIRVWVLMFFPTGISKKRNECR